MEILTRECVFCGEEERYSPFYDYDDTEHNPNCNPTREQIRTQKLPYEINQEAIDKVLASRPEYRTFRELIEAIPSDISSLRMFGYACVQCGKKKITYPILKYYDYGTMAKCYDCQNGNSHK